jgi:hypothetical protein
MGPLHVDALLSHMVREQKSLVGVNIFCNTLPDPLKKSLAALSVGDFHGGIRGRLPPKRVMVTETNLPANYPRSQCPGSCHGDYFPRQLGGLSLVELVRIPASNFFQKITETLKAFGIISHEFRTARPPLQRCNHFTAQSLLNGSLEWLAA